MGDIAFELKDGVALIRLSNPARKNALSRSMVRELTRIALELQENREIAAVVLTGDRASFSAGVDLREIAEWNKSPHDLEERLVVSELGGKMCHAWEQVPQITIAAIEGFNVGGGIALTMTCDWRIMGRSSYLYVPEVQIGIPLVWQSMPRLINMIGLSRAKQVLLLGEKMPAAKALEWGLADFVADDGDTVVYAERLARKVAAMPSLAVRVTKKSANNYANHINQLASAMDVELSVLFSTSQDAVHGRSRFERKND